MSIEKDQDARHLRMQKDHRRRQVRANSRSRQAEAKCTKCQGMMQEPARKDLTCAVVRCGEAAKRSCGAGCDYHLCHEHSQVLVSLGSLLMQTEEATKLGDQLRELNHQLSKAKEEHQEEVHKLYLAIQEKETELAHCKHELETSKEEFKRRTAERLNGNETDEMVAGFRKAVKRVLASHPTRGRNTFLPSGRHDQGFEGYEDGKEDLKEITIGVLDESKPLGFCLYTGQFKDRLGLGADSVFMCTDEGGNPWAVKQYAIPKGDLSFSATLSLLLRDGEGLKRAKISDEMVKKWLLAVFGVEPSLDRGLKVRKPNVPYAKPRTVDVEFTFMIQEEGGHQLAKYQRLCAVQGKARRLALPWTGELEEPQIFQREAAADSVHIDSVLVQFSAEASKKLAQIYSELLIKRMEVTAGLSNLVRYERVIETDKSIFVLMEKLHREWLYGCDFYDFLHGGVGDERKVFVGLKNRPDLFGVWREQLPKTFKQMVMAVKALHDKEVIHMDLKPENFWLRGHFEQGDFQVVLLDFGMACFKEDARAGWTGAVDDPPDNYGGPVPSIATDMFRLGTTLYQMLCARRTWTKSNAMKAEIKSGEVDFLEAVKRGWVDKPGLFSSYSAVPDEIREVLEKLLSKNPAVRGTCDDILKSKWLKSVPLPFSPHRRSKSSPALRPRGSQTRSALQAVAGVSLFV